MQNSIGLVLPFDKVTTDEVILLANTLQKEKSNTLWRLSRKRAGNKGLEHFKILLNDDQHAPI